MATEVIVTRLVNHDPPHSKYYCWSVNEETDGTFTHTIEYGRDVPGVVPRVTSKPHATRRRGQKCCTLSSYRKCGGMTITLGTIERESCE